MRAHASLLAAFVTAIIALTACTDPGPAGGAPPDKRDTHDHGGGDHGGGDHGGGGGGMM